MSPKVMHDDLYPAVVLFISYEAHQLPRTVVLAYLFYISLPAKFLHQKQTLLFIVVVRNQNSALQCISWTHFWNYNVAPRLLASLPVAKNDRWQKLIRAIL